MRWIYVLVVGLGAAAAGCDRTKMPAREERAQVVDSILPRDEALRRFQQHLQPAAELRNSYQSREALMRAFVAALAGRDTAVLASMAISSAEFGYLYYPTTPQSRPPYDLGPGLMWHMLQQRSERGIRRALNVYGGQQLRLLSHDCGQESSREGENTVAGPCVLRLRDQRGKSVSLLLSQIIERGGRHKVLSYANKL